MPRSLAALTAAFAVLALPALAGPATQDGADRLARAFQTYLGPLAQVASVVPRGDSYALTLDAAPMFALGKDAGVTGSVTPLVLTLTDIGDGSWGVAMDQPLSVQAKMDGAFDLKEDVAGAKMTGIFDEKLMSFTKLDSALSGIRVEESFTPKGQQQTHAVAAFDTISVASTGTANPQGGVDLVAQIEMTGLSEVATVSMAGEQASVPVTIKAEGISETASITGLRIAPLMQVLAWGMAHDTALKAMAYRAEVKPLATAALPVFSAMSAQATVRLVSVDTPVGTVGVKEMGVDIDLNGLVADGKLREALSVSGLTLPEGLAPAWVAPVLPQQGSFDVQVTGYDAAAAVNLALAVLDLPDGKDPAPEFQDNLLAAFLPKGVVSVTLNPGAIEGDGYRLDYQGSLDAGPATTIPTGKATITLSGYDRLQTALNAAPDDVKLQTMMGMGAMRGLAKVGAGGVLTWDIDATTPGQVLVNGMDVSKIGGGN